MKVLICHNHYLQPGGEDRVFALEAGLLEDRGHRVRRYSVHNRDIAAMSRLALAAGTLWNRAEAERIRDLIRRDRPDLVHFHNTFPLISPAAYHAARSEGLPVVQTLHNFRLACPAATFYRDGRVCQDCLGRRLAWPAVRHACYRGSRAQSAVTAGMLALHRGLGTWQRQVERWIALTAFARDKLVAAGLPAERVVVKPNFVPDPGPPDGGPRDPRRGLFVGRLAPEKGVATLIEACAGLDLEMTVIGDGPLRAELAARAPANVRVLGNRPAPEVLTAMRRAGFLAVPSTWFEGFPMVVAEAFACGLPVLAAGLGGLAEIVEDGVTGRHVAPGDVRAWAEALAWARANPQALTALGRAARRRYEASFSPDQGYRALTAVYHQAVAAAAGLETAA